jgi:hypothetical protein
MKRDKPLRAEGLAAEAGKNKQQKGRNMMKTTMKTNEGWMKSMMLAGCVALCFAGATARGQASNVNALGGDWANPANWNPAGVPDQDVNVFINFDRTQTLSSGTHTANTVRICTVGTGTQSGNFNMTGGSLAIDIDLSMGYAGVGGTGTTTLSGGTLSAQNVSVGHTDADVAGVLNISGGTLNWTQGLRVGTLGSGTLVVDGTGATISGANVFLEANSTLQFDLGAASVSAIAASGGLTIDSAADLVIDGSNFTGGEGDVIDLVTFGGSKTGEFDTSNITFQNFGSGLTGEVGYDDDSMYMTVIPEPGTIGLFVISAAGLMVVRRNLKK